MRPSRDRPAFVVIAALFLTVISSALASWVPKTSADTASVQRFCTNAGSLTATPVVGLQCQFPVRIITGKRNPDAGYVSSTGDGGLTPISTSELVTFPGDTYPIQLGTGEKCVGVQSADAGTNLCTFFDGNGP